MSLAPSLLATLLLSGAGREGIKQMRRQFRRLFSSAGFAPSVAIVCWQKDAVDMRKDTIWLEITSVSRGLPMNGSELPSF